MDRIFHIEQLLMRSRRAIGLALVLVLAGLALLVAIVTWQVRQRIREQIASRDGEVLYAVALMHYAEDVKDGLAGPITDPGNQLSIVLRSSQLRGVMGVRLFDPDGRFVESFPPEVTEGALAPGTLPRLQALRPTCRFYPHMRLSELFYSGKTDPATGAVAVLEADVPLHLPEGRLAGIAQFLVEGQSLSAEFARLDRHLAWQAGMALAGAGAVLGVMLAAAFRRLRRAHQLVAERTQDLIRANQELALAAKTSALGTITAHLIHGLKSPLAGVQQYVASRGAAAQAPEWETDWQQAVAATGRMQAVISQVVGVLRENQAGAAYAVTPAELEEIVRARVESLARERGVRLETAVSGDTEMPNRVASLIALILVNLVENGVQATPKGKTVKLVLDCRANGLSFEVHDQGPGVPADLPLFMPCASQKEGGTGIGLALSKQLANHLGAELTLAKSTPEGCVFALRVQADRGSRAEPAVASGSVLSLCILALALLGPLRLSAVDFPLRWHWSNPAPHGGNVVDMAYSPTLGLGIQVAERGQIYTSSDLDLWLPRDSGTTCALRAVTFFGNRILVTGESGTVLYADDLNQFLPGTLADGATSDWLEAVAAGPQVAVAAGDNGSIYTTSQGSAWTKRFSNTTAWLRGVAYGSAAGGGSGFVAVGDYGTIITSPTGLTWTLRSSPTQAHLNRVKFATGRFTAVGDGGVTLHSLNGGASWTLDYPGATNTLQHPATCGSDRLVVGTHEVRLQENGVWSDELAKVNGPPDWTYYAAVGECGFFLIAGQTGLQSEGYQQSTSPYYWLTPYNSVRNWLWDVVHLPAFYTTVGDYGTILTSGNGVDWTLELTPPAATNTTLLGIGGTTNLLLAVGDTGTILYSPNILSNIVVTNTSGVVTQSVSSLGVLWYPLPGPSPTTRDLQAVGVLSNSLYVVGGGGGVLLTSTDGTNWLASASPTTNLLSSIAEWPGGLIASGVNGTLLTSADGLKWTKLNVANANWLYRVRWLNRQILAVGQNGTILTSADGSNWTSRASGTTAWLTDAAYIQDTWFVFGNSGTVLTSPDLLNWTNRGTITRKFLFGAATDGRQLVTVGVEGAILRSQVVPDLSPVAILDYDRVTTNGVAEVYNVFLFGGKPDQRFRLELATNVVNATWAPGPQFDIFDGSGLLYYYETLTGTNLPPKEYYRTKLVR